MTVHTDRLFNSLLALLTKKYLRLFDEKTATELAKESATSVFVLLFASRPTTDKYHPHLNFLITVMGMNERDAHALLEESLTEDFRTFVMSLHLTGNTH